MAIAAATLISASEAQAGFLDDLNRLGNEINKLGDNVDKLMRQKPPQQSPPARPQEQHQSQPQSQPAGPAAYNGDRQRVAKAQDLLNRLGYDAGAADGLYGARTRSAIESYEADRSLPRRGDVTDALIARLSQEAPPATATAAAPKSGAPDAKPAAATTPASRGAPPGETLVAPALGGAPIASAADAKPAASAAAAKPAAAAPDGAGAPTSSRGMIAPAPAGGLIAPAPGGGRIASGAPPAPVPAAAPAPAPTVLASPNEFDPLAPAGISIGMPGADALAKIEAAGYRRSSDAYVRADGKIRYTMRFRSKDGWHSKTGLVTWIHHIRDNADLGLSGVDFAKRLSDRLGVEPACSMRQDPLAQCQWNGPPKAPRLKQVALMFNRSSSHSQLTISIAAADSVAASPESAAPQRPIDLDPLAPFGIAIGMPLSAAEKAIAAQGYKASPTACRFYDAGGKDITLKLSTKAHCLAREPVRSVTYQAYGIRVEEPLNDLLARMNEKVGAPATCQTVDGMMYCNWQSPARAPLIQTIDFRANKASLYLDITAVPDMEARVAQPAAKPWWAQELAQADARPEKFSGSESYAKLTAGEQARYGEEAAFVYDYCKGRETFAALHDCRCVAGKFIDARVAREKTPQQNAGTVRQLHPKTLDSSEYRTELIGAADRVADQCPNKAGTANYAYQRCESSYGNIMREGLETFCTCYADVFVTAYMNEPRSHMTHIKNMGVFALQECRRRGIRGPHDR